MKRTLYVASAIALAAGVIAPTTAAVAAGGDPNGSRSTVSAKPAALRSSTQVGTPHASARTSFIVTLPLRDAGGAAALARAVSDPASRSFRHYVEPAAFTKKYAATSADAAAVTKWLKSEGLVPATVPSSRTYIPVTGTTRAINRAFRTTVATYTKGSRTFQAPATALTVPSSMAGRIQGVIGLDRSRVLSTKNVRPDPLAKRTSTAVPRTAAKTATRTKASNACSTYYGQYTLPNIDKAAPPFKGKLPGALCGYTPSQLDAARGIDRVGSTGKGAKIGITLWCNDPRIFGDTNRWAKAVGAKPLKASQYALLTPAGGYDPDYCDDQDSGGVNAEQALDVQSIHGAAPSANIVYSSAAAPFDDALITSLHTLVDNNLVDAITNSWGGGEVDDPATNDAYSAVFIQAAAQGISVLFSSGDYGDNTRGDQTKTPPSPDYPAANPWVTAVGGTSLGTGNKSGSRVLFEQGWNNSISTEKNDTWGPWTYRYGGGGGTSDYHLQPYYQKGVVPARFAGAVPHRVYPDLAGAADPYTGYLIGYHDAAASSGSFVLGKIGGTSWSSPFTAGTLALAGGRVGFLNPIIYGKGHAGLTDVKGNQLTKGFEVYRTLVNAAGSPYTVLTTVALNAQSLQNQTLSSDKGYDNLTGFGVPTNTKAFLKAIE